MATPYCKLALAFVLIIFHFPDTNGFMNDTFKAAVHKSLKAQCEKWYNLSSDTSVPFVFSKRQSLSLVTISSTENIGTDFLDNKVVMTQMKHNNSSNADTETDAAEIHMKSFVIQCRSAYPVSMVINLWPKFAGDVSDVNPQNPYEKKQTSRWEVMKSVLGGVFLASTHLKINISAAILSVSVECSEINYPGPFPRYVSKFHFDISGGSAYLPMASDDMNGFYVTMTYEPGILSVCLPMFSFSNEEDWLYKMFTDLPKSKKGFTTEDIVTGLSILIAICGVIGVIKKVINRLKTTSFASMRQVQPTEQLPVPELTISGGHNRLQLYMETEV